MDQQPSFDLLRTKLYRPRVTADFIARPRLADRLVRSLDRKVVLVTAPPGYGKTTLIAGWLRDQPVAWLSLDEGDDELPAFLASLIAALRTIVSDACLETHRLLQSNQSPPLAVYATTLINELDVLRQPLTLTVTNAGYITQSKNGISGTGGAIVVNHFDLRLDAPCLNTAPSALLSQQKTNQRLTQTLTLSNSGVALLNWSITEQAAASRPIVIDTLPVSAFTRDHGEPGRNAHSSLLPTAPQMFSPLPDFNMTQNVSLTQSTSQDLVFGTSMACFDWMSGNTLANSYYRVYDLPTYGITDSLKVSGIDIGIEEATTSVGQQRSAVKLYTLNGDFVVDNLTLIASANDTITDQVLTKVTLPITAIVPAGSKLVVEVYSPNLLSDNSLFYLGANSEPETGQSYIRSLPCGINEPTPTDDQGMPAHYIPNVVGLTWPTCDVDLPWASVNPLGGFTAANGSSPIDVVFNSTGLADGVYTGNLCVFSNDQVQPTTGVPLKMIVGLIHKAYLPLIAKNK